MMRPVYKKCPHLSTLYCARLHRVDMATGYSGKKWDLPAEPARLWAAGTGESIGTGEPIGGPGYCVGTTGPGG